MAKTYFISFNGVDYSEFFPSNRPKITNALQPEEKFFRSRVDEFSIPRVTNLTVVDNLDSFFFDNTKFGTTLNFKIKKSGVDTYLFRMSVNEGEFDDEKKVFKCTPRPDDNYQDILDLYEIKWQDTLANTLFGQNDTVWFPEDNNDVFTNIDFDTFSDTNNGAGIPNDVVIFDDSGNPRTARQEVTVGTLGNLDWVVMYITAQAGTPIEADITDAGGASVSVGGSQTINGVKKLYFQISGTHGNIYLELADTLTDMSFSYLLYGCTEIGAAGDDLMSIIEVLLTGAAYMNLVTYTGDVVSTFLNNDALGSDPPPDIDTFIGANPTEDYVIEDTAVWNNIFMMKTHLLTTAKQSLFELSFKDLMDILKAKMRVFWHLDEDGKFRLEHEYYYRDFTSQLNITTAPEIADKPEVDVSLFNYDKSSIFSSVNHAESNQVNEDFIPQPVTYDAEITTPASNDINIAELSTDVEYVYNNPDDADNIGFMLLQCDIETGDEIMVANKSVFGDTYYINQRLSWAHLFANYWGYFAEAGAGTVNGGAKNFDGVKEFLKQTGIKFYYDGELDWRKPVTLNNGLAWLEQWEESEDEFLTINVGYDPYL